MKTTVKNLSDTRVKLTIALDKSELKDAQQTALVKMARTLKVAGFRKGKVPVSVAAKHVDPNELAQQTVDAALNYAVAKAFMDEKLQVLDRPEVELKKFVPEQELEFTAEVDVLPAVKLGDYKKLKVKQEKVTLEPKEIDDVLERMRTQLAEKKEVKRAAKKGDIVSLDFVGKKDDVAFEGGAAKDYELELGSNSFIPGFEEGLEGLKAGDKKDLKLKFPKDYHAKELAGADVVFETTVKAVSEKTLPKLDDEFAKKMSPGDDVSTLKDLKANLKAELTAQKEREAGEKHKDNLVAKLIEVSNVPVPEVLVNDQVRSIEQDMQQNLMYQNITFDNYLSAQGFASREDWVEKEATPAAKKRVQAGLVLAQLAKELEVAASDEELEAHIARYKAQYQNNPEALKQFENPEVIRDIGNRLVTEKTVEKLVELNK